METDSWASRKCCHLHAAVTCLSWLSGSEFVICCEGSAELHVVKIGGNPSDVHHNEGNLYAGKEVELMQCFMLLILARRSLINSCGPLRIAAR